MPLKTKRNSCLFCGRPADMIIKAPLATTVQSCDKHKNRATGMGERAIMMNLQYLEGLADENKSPSWRERQVARQARIKPATDEWLAKQETRQSQLSGIAAMNMLQYELAQVQAELQRDRENEAVERAAATLVPEVRAAAIADMRRRGKDYFQRANDMRRVR